MMSGNILFSIIPAASAATAAVPQSAACDGGTYVPVLIGIAFAALVVFLYFNNRKPKKTSPTDLGFPSEKRDMLELSDIIGFFKEEKTVDLLRTNGSLMAVAIKAFAMDAENTAADASDLSKAAQKIVDKEKNPDPEFPQWCVACCYNKDKGELDERCGKVFFAKKFSEDLQKTFADKAMIMFS